MGLTFLVARWHLLKLLVFLLMHQIIVFARISQVSFKWWCFSCIRFWFAISSFWWCCSFSNVMNESCCLPLSFFELLESGFLLLLRVIAATFCVTLAASMAARLGSTSMAAFQICLQVWLAASLLADGLAVAGQVSDFLFSFSIFPFQNWMQQLWCTSIPKFWPASVSGVYSRHPTHIGRTNSLTAELTVGDSLWVTLAVL